jgi:hypothetical protein
MARRCEVALAQICAMETKVRETIDTCVVLTSQHMPYSDFARQPCKTGRR